MRDSVTLYQHLSLAGCQPRISPMFSSHLFSYWWSTVWSAVYKDHFRYTPSQWEMSLHCNNISHLLGAYIDCSLYLWFQICFLWSNITIQNGPRYPLKSRHFKRKALFIKLHSSLPHSVILKHRLSLWMETSHCFSFTLTGLKHLQQNHLHHIHQINTCSFSFRVNTM